MPFTTPLALLGLLFIPAVIAMYLLRLRRDQAVVPSTLLWSRLVEDVEANAPWQRLRRSLLLLLQLLLVLILALLAARPFVERPAGLAGDLVLIIDTSASMSATDVLPSRLDVAKDAALEALRDLPAGGKVSIIAAGRAARVVANGAGDPARIRQAIEAIQPTADIGDIGDALRLADALAARAVDAEILVATDAALALTPRDPTRAPIRVLQVGRGRANQAIVALAVRTAPSGVTRSVFVSVANLDLERTPRRLEVVGDGLLLEARELLLEAQARSEIVVDDIPGTVRVVEVRLAAPLNANGDPGAGDQLALDDRAWAIVPPEHLRRVLVVSDGDPFLETALTYLPNTEVYGVTFEKYGPATHPEKFDLIVFERDVPADLPAVPILAIAPARTSALGEVSGKLEAPGIGQLDPADPILRYVDLSTTHIAEARRLALPEWARTVIPGPRGAPLLYVGARAGLPTAVLAFEPRQSDLPLQVAFPILIANLTGELLGAGSAPLEALRPGDPVALTVPPGAAALRVERPDGTVTELVPSSAAGRAVTFSQTDLLGVYTIFEVPAAASPDPDGASPEATQSPSPSPLPSASSSGEPEPTVEAPSQFVVDLFAVAESDIAPGDPKAIEALGGAIPPASPDGSASPAPSLAVTPSPSTSPVAGGGQGGDRPPARDELWIPIALLVLAFVLVEWLVYQRDAATRIWRSMAGRRGSPEQGR